MNDNIEQVCQHLQHMKRIVQVDRAVRPYREDGYVNVLNKYGTEQDNSEAYTYEQEVMPGDETLGSLYESNGLFAKIIDAPAEEALKHGYELGLNDPDVESFVSDALDELDWDEKAATAIKWARLYGGAIIVMLVDDGREIWEPLDWKRVRSIDELRVYERAVVQPDYNSMYSYDTGRGKGNRGSRFCQPEYYDVMSVYGSFRVHESRCMVFKNGVVQERVSNPNYRYWGIPEYVRMRQALLNAVTSHHYGNKLLERSVQPVYKMKGLAALLASDDEDQVLKRLQVIDMARGLLNSIAIDNDGEDYDFKTFQIAGVSDVIDGACNMLSAITNIPQTVLFGRAPAGMNATGESDQENWYNFVERIQKLMLRRNMRYLLDVIFTAGLGSGEIKEEPDYKLTFSPLWSISESEQATIEQVKATTEFTKAQTAQLYVDMQALDPSEVRRGLAASEAFSVENLLDDTDEDELWGEDEPLEDDLKVSGVNSDGGSGSGNFGHQGRPGELGGSGEGGNLSEEGRKNADRIKSSLPSTMSESQKAKYITAVEKEPVITNDMKQITASVGAELVGLENRIKSPESFERKIATDIELGGMDEETAIKNVMDTLRYTSVSAPSNLTDNYLKTLEQMEERGYTKVRVNSTWGIEDVNYKGVNAIFESSSGEKFELQFHTKESFELKQGKLHSLYEEYRLPSTTPERKTELDNEMIRLSASLTVPNDIDKIK